MSNTFNGLTKGTYTPRVRNGTATYCDLVVGNPVTLDDPATPEVLSATPTNPASCGADGSLALTFSDVPDGYYTVNYDGGSFTNVHVTSNTATISTPADNFYNLNITTHTTCTSPATVDAVFDTTAPATPNMTAEPAYTIGTNNTVSTPGTTDAGVKCVQYQFCRSTTDDVNNCSTTSSWQA